MRAGKVFIVVYFRICNNISIYVLKELQVMKEWNILATASMRQERYLLRLLSKYGDFKGSGYRNVIIGRVENVENRAGVGLITREMKEKYPLIKVK